VARSTGALFAGNICNSNIYDPGDEKAGWDRGILSIELQALIDLNFEVELIRQMAIEFLRARLARPIGRTRFCCFKGLPYRAQEWQRAGALRCAGGRRVEKDSRSYLAPALIGRSSRVIRR
jgi:hypothetical protein